VAGAHRLVVTVEDNGRIGGVGAAVAQELRDAGAVLSCALAAACWAPT
jgi:1-deoxy-D-xylulose-5-phosphate synthase